MSDWAEALLFAAARSQLASEVVGPALAAGWAVVSDRSVYSSLAYQGGARGLGIDLVRRVNEAGLGGVWPETVVLLRLDPARGLAREEEANRISEAGVALQMELDPLLKKVQRKQLIRAAAYKRRNEMILRILEQHTGVSYAPYRTRVIWGPLLLAAGMMVMVQRGCRRVLFYLGGPLLLAFGAACLHRYPFMAHYGGNRLMLFSAPVLYLLVAAGGWGIFAWLWRRRRRWLALAMTALLLAALNLRAGIKENLSPVNNREQIQPLVAHLEANLQPQDMIYVYYFAVAPFKYYYRGANPGICWGRSCVEQGLDPAAQTRTPPQRLWLIASHIPDLAFLRQFAAKLLGPDWREAACFTGEGAALLRFDREPQPGAVKTPNGPPALP